MVEALSNLLEEVKYRYVKATTPRILRFIGKSSRSLITGAFHFTELFGSTPSQRYMMRVMREAFKRDLPLSWTIKRLCATTNPTMRRKVANYISDAMTICQDRQKPYSNRYGVAPPYTILISPTMRCNHRCVGCFAGEYDSSSDMAEELVDRIIREANEIGINYITLLGGETFVYRPIWNILRRNPNTLFQLFTNGTLIDEKVTERLVSLGNVVPTISIEGFERETDERRGRGTFKRVSKAMDRLRDAGVIYFYSVTVTRKNIETVVSDDFINFMIEKGSPVGWYFNYMPVGRDPDLSLMPTPEQRNLLRRRAIEIRNEKPLLIIDFFGDGPVVGGCLAGGRHFIHITNNGDVEPCIFCHTSVDNIKDKSLPEVLNSDFFKAIRRSQPFGHNEIRPCPLIDHPGAMAALARKYGARPTHPGADCLFEELLEPLKRYSKKVAGIYEPIWRKEYGWVENWERIWRGTFLRPARQGGNGDRPAEAPHKAPQLSEPSDENGKETDASGNGKREHGRPTYIRQLTRRSNSP
ncbi:MAG: radical SAM protein [Actinobacteria bacterium]|nr:radical SAM protein [Actinomycetota bacterium]